MAAQCTHVKDHVKKVKPHTKGCEECLKTGDTWVHLRMCLECGHVGCCDSSKNRHARAHFHDDAASADSIRRARRRLALVLHRRDVSCKLSRRQLASSTSIFFVSASSLTILKLRIWPAAERLGLG